HLLGRLLSYAFDGDEQTFSNLEQNMVSFVHNRLYTHKVIRVNYTTYDLRRCYGLDPWSHLSRSLPLPGSLSLDFWPHHTCHVTLVTHRISTSVHFRSRLISTPSLCSPHHVPHRRALHLRPLSLSQSIFPFSPFTF